MKAMAGDMGNIIIGADGNGDSPYYAWLTLNDGKYAVKWFISRYA